MNTLDLLNYYANLLIYQYVGKSKAYATIQESIRGVLLAQTSTQEISFSSAPTSGSFVLSYNGNNTATIQWNDSVATIQSDLRALTGLGSLTVSGSIASQLLTVTFTGVPAPALLLEVASSSLVTSGSSVTISVTETDVTLPLAVQDAFNLTGSNIAQGVQLDILGKYTGVSRAGVGSISLDDADFLTLIRFAIIINNAQSDLQTIVNSIYSFFGTNILVFDYQNMHMSFLISSSVGSQDLVQLLVVEGLLPAPMTVQVSVIYAPVIDAFFGFVTYQNPTAMNNSPFNTYEDYHGDWPWLDYSDGLSPLVSMATESGNIIIQENGDALYVG